MSGVQYLAPLLLPHVVDGGSELPDLCQQGLPVSTAQLLQQSGLLRQLQGEGREGGREGGWEGGREGKRSSALAYKLKSTR